MLSLSPLMIALGALLLGSLLVLWQMFGPGPRRRRGLRRAQWRLREGAWADALERVRKLRDRGSPSVAWLKRFDVFEAECLQAAGPSLIAEKEFDRALEQLLRAARLLGQPELDVRLRVQAAMLEEVRRMFATPAFPNSTAPTGKGTDALLGLSLSPQSERGRHDAILDLIGRVVKVHAPCREASFWQGLYFLRGGELVKAREALESARNDEIGVGGKGASATAFIDPPLYLGALLLKQGQARESLRYLTEANRIDGNCPIVTLQLGAAIVEAGGDTQLAVRALQRAVGPSGLPIWAGNPRQAWIEAFPEGRSYVRKLAGVHPFVCPLWGSDMSLLIRQGRLALAQGLYKLGQFQEAADLFGAAMKEGAPSLPVIRGLGLALARRGDYDGAFKHLRLAHEMEEPKDRVTAGFMALCGARGTPTNPEDKARNIAWAIALVTQFTAPGDREWAALVSVLFADARAENVRLSSDDQLYLCEHLWSVHETDPAAAHAFHQLAMTYPAAVRSEYAWLFCRAAQLHGIGGERALDLFAMTFRKREQAQEFFAQKQWDFGDLEFTYLALAAQLAPGRFPEALGPDLASHADKILTRSVLQEKAGDMEASLKSADVLSKLAPGNAKALDRLAALHYRCGEIDQAVAVLESWHAVHPQDPLPLVRLAILLQQRGQLGECQNRLRAAMELTQGLPRFRIASLGARLTLQALLVKSAETLAASLDREGLAVAQQFLEDALKDDAADTESQWLLAAVRWLNADRVGLADQGAALGQTQVTDPRYHFFAALSRWSAADFSGALEAAGRSMACASAAAESPRQVEGSHPGSDGDSGTPHINWQTENSYLIALTQLDLGSAAAAAEALKRPAFSNESPSIRHAQALLGLIGFTSGEFDDAGKWWQMLDAKDRAAWKLAEPLAGAVFLAGLEAFRAGRFEEAADKLRSAGKLGHRDRRLGSLLVMSLFKAGRQAVYGA